MSYGKLSEFQFKNITTATTTAVKAGPGLLSHIQINGGTLTGDITIYNNTAASGATVGTIAGGAGQMQGQIYTYNCFCDSGITIVTAQAANLTVVYI